MATENRQLRHLPSLPGTEESHALVRGRISSLPHLPNYYRHSRVRYQEAERRAIDALGRTIESKYGWKATLLGNTVVESGDLGVPYLLLDILAPLCDWWEEMAYDAVMDCPPPENVRYPKMDRHGRSRMIRTIREGYDRTDYFIFDDIDWGSLHLPMKFTFDGKALVRDTIWPFAPPDLIDPMAARISAALGSQLISYSGGRKRKERLWTGSVIQGRSNWANRRVYMHWSS